jgi:hypothetical protein
MSWIDNLSEEAKKLIVNPNNQEGSTWIDKLSEGARKMIVPQTFQQGSKPEQIMQASRQAGQEIQQKIGQPIAEKTLGIAKKTVPAVSEPGTTYITPQLKKMGASPLIAGGIGLGLDILAPGGAGEKKAGKILGTEIKGISEEVLKAMKSGKIKDAYKIAGDKFGVIGEQIVDDARVFKEVKQYDKLKNFLNNEFGNYAKNATKKGGLEKNAVNWLKEWTQKAPGETFNLPLTKDIESVFSKYKPQKPVRLFRGIEIGEEGIQKPLTSWTYNKEIAKEHTYGKGKVISKVFQPNEILVDITEMPSTLQKKIRAFEEESEVIIKNIPSDNI